MDSITAARRDAFLTSAACGPCVMGVINVTPDSFSDGGLSADPAAATARGHALVADGAAILDIGGESTRPGFTPVAADEEWRRIGPVMAALAAEVAVPLSVDTAKAEVASRALAAGAAVINDIWGFRGDPNMAAIVSAAEAGAVLMHNRREVDASLDIVDDMLRFFAASLAIADDAGIPHDRLVLDPGIGFGKTQGQQLDAIRGIARLRAAFGLPVLVGLSRKSFLGRITGAPVARRGAETLSANLAAAAAGASVFRVHDVADHVAAFAVSSAIAAAGPRGETA